MPKRRNETTSTAPVTRQKIHEPCRTPEVLNMSNIVSTVVEQRPRLSFLDLPGEVRNIIYAYVVIPPNFLWFKTGLWSCHEHSNQWEDFEDAATHWVSLPPATCNPFEEVDIARGARPWLGLFLACKQIHNEASYTQYKESTICVSVSMLLDGCSGEVLQVPEPRTRAAKNKHIQIVPFMDWIARFRHISIISYMETSNNVVRLLKSRVTHNHTVHFTLFINDYIHRASYDGNFAFLKKRHDEVLSFRTAHRDINSHSRIILVFRFISSRLARTTLVEFVKEHPVSQFEELIYAARAADLPVRICLGNYLPQCQLILASDANPRP